MSGVSINYGFHNNKKCAKTFYNLWACSIELDSHRGAVSLRHNVYYVHAWGSYARDHIKIASRKINFLQNNKRSRRNPIWLLDTHEIYFSLPPPNSGRTPFGVYCYWLYAQNRVSFYICGADILIIVNHAPPPQSYFSLLSIVNHRSFPHPLNVGARYNLYVQMCTLGYCVEKHRCHSCGGHGNGKTLLAQVLASMRDD